MSTRPIFSPPSEGDHLADIPADKYDEALRNGFRPASSVTSPEGRDALIPADKVTEAVNEHGFAAGPSYQQPKVKMYTPKGEYAEIPSNARQYALQNGWKVGAEMTSPLGFGMTIHPDLVKDAIGMGWKAGPPSQQEKPGFITKTVGGMMGVDSADIANSRFSNSEAGKGLKGPDLYSQGFLGGEMKTDEDILAKSGIILGTYNKLNSNQQKLALMEARQKLQIPWEERTAEALPIAGSMVRAGVKSAQSAKEGRYSEAVGHAGAAALPIVGPMAEGAGEEFGAGHVKEGFQQAGLALAPFAATPVEVGVRGYQAAKSAVAPLIAPKPPLARAIPGLSNFSAETAAPLMKQVLDENLKPTTEEVLDHVGKMKEQLSNIEDKSADQVNQLNALDEVEKALTKEHETAQENDKKAPATTPLKQIGKGVVKSAIGTAVARAIPEVIPGAVSHPVLDYIGLAGGAKDISAGITRLLKKGPVTSDLLESRLNKALQAIPREETSIQSTEGTQTAATVPQQTPQGTIKPPVKGEFEVNPPIEPSEKIIEPEPRSPETAPGPDPYPKIIDEVKAGLQHEPFSPEWEQEALKNIANLPKSQLNAIAKARGIDFKRGTSAEELAGKVYDDLTPEEVQGVQNIQAAAKAKANQPPSKKDYISDLEESVKQAQARRASQRGSASEEDITGLLPLTSTAEKNIVGSKQGAASDTANFQRALQQVGNGKNFGDLSVQDQSQVLNLAQRYKKEGGFAKVDQSEKLAPMFFSRAEEAIKNKLPPFFSADQAKGTLRNAGIGGDELRLASDWLDSQESKKINKQDLLDHMQQNGIKLNEIVKGGELNKEDLDTSKWTADIRPMKDFQGGPTGYDRVSVKNGEGYTVAIWHSKSGTVNQKQAIDSIAKDARESPEDYKHVFSSGPTKYHEYQLPRSEENEAFDQRAYDRALEAAEEDLDHKGIFEEMFPGRRYEPFELTKKENDRAMELARMTFDERREKGVQDEYHKLLARNDYGPDLTDEEKDSFDDRISREAEERADDYYEGDSTTSGGKNYREVLLQLPDRESKVGSSEKFNSFKESLKNKYGEDWSDLLSTSENSKLHDLEKNAIYGRVSQFNSSHWDEPNVLVHLRMNDRNTVDGKKALFLEEIQSDWHQQGREKGYSSPLSINETEDLVKQINDFRESHGGAHLDQIMTDREIARDKEWEKSLNPEDLRKYEELDSRLQNADKEGVPDAPFKKDWHELALKYALRKAAEGGYDKLAWTTGDQQAERYDLSRHVDSIKATYSGEGYYNIVANQKGETTPIVSKMGVAAKDLPELLGKDLAKKILDDSKDTPNNHTWSNTYSGDDLKVGGHGMSSFYDQMIPQFLNKYGKKWGAKVGESELPGMESTSDTPYGLKDFYPSMSVEERGKWYLTNEGEDFISDGKIKPGHDEDSPPQYFNSKKEAQQYLDSLKDSSIKIHSIDITPAMKHDLLKKGQPISEVQPTSKETVA